MAGKLPYVAYPSGMINVLNKIKQATTPERLRKILEDLNYTSE